MISIICIKNGKIIDENQQRKKNLEWVLGLDYDSRKIGKHTDT